MTFPNAGNLGREASMRSREVINRHLETLCRPRIGLLSRLLPSFQVWGITGLAVAIILDAGLVVALGMSAMVLAGIAVVAVAAFLALAMATKILTGEERIIYYHHEIAVMLVTAAFLWLTRQPMLPYLDITIFGIGAFLACGRIGCFMVGCCHGRPHRFGVRYTLEHATAGFTHYYVGVRLFPIQLVESLWVAGVVFVGVLLILAGRPAGAALAWYVVAYDLGRFFFEFLRGDPDRPYLWGFSQPQWISLVLMAVVVFLEQRGLLPLTRWHVLAAAILGVVMIATVVRRRLRRVPLHRLLDPRHVRELAAVIEAIAGPSSQSPPPFRWTVVPARDSRLDMVQVGSTSAGVQISTGRVLDGPGAPGRHYSLSCRGTEMSEEAARLLAGLIGQLDHRGVFHLVKGNRGVFHAFFEQDGQEIA